MHKLVVGSVWVLGLLVGCGDDADPAAVAAGDAGGAGIETVTGSEGLEATLEDGRIDVQLKPCPSGQVLKSNGHGYACAEDLSGSAGAPDGGGGRELMSCPEGQILKSNGDGYDCADDETGDMDTDTDTTYTAAEGGGLAVDDEEFRLEVCPEGEILKSTGDDYECADDEDSAAGEDYLPISGGNVEGSVSVEGDLGIGTETPAARLDITDDTKANILMSADPDLRYELGALPTGLQLTQTTGPVGGFTTTNPLMTVDSATRDVRVGSGGSITLYGNNSIRFDGAMTVEATNLNNDFTANDSTHVFFANTTSNSITVTLPTPVGRIGRIYTIKKTSASNTLTITTAANTIEGAASINLVAIYAYRTVISNGTNWMVIGQ
jgi:hypothetical protein